MSTEYRSTQQAAKTVANFFLLENWTSPTTITINIKEIRELRDSLTVIEFYLKKKRREIEAGLLDSAYEFEYQREISNGYFGDNVSSNGSGPDHELLVGEGDGELVKRSYVVMEFKSRSSRGGVSPLHLTAFLCDFVYVFALQFCIVYYIFFNFNVIQL